MIPSGTPLEAGASTDHRSYHPSSLQQSFRSPPPGRRVAASGSVAIRGQDLSPLVSPGGRGARRWGAAEGSVCGSMHLLMPTLTTHPLAPQLTQQDKLEQRAQALDRAPPNEGKRNSFSA